MPTMGSCDLVVGRCAVQRMLWQVPCRGRGAAPGREIKGQRLRAMTLHRVVLGVPPGFKIRVSV